MAHFEERDLLKLSKLSRIALSEEERKKLFSSLKSILAYVNQLDEIDTSNVPPFTHILETVSNVMREDLVEKTLSRELFLSNAPAHTGGMIRVPPVMKGTE
ncbi:MAG: Asp-tRNA(Asn)/Glu-tRNA(Gln) amidotransferase subunit GatC [Chlamydiales bacterium]